MYVIPNHSGTKILLQSDLLEQEHLKEATIYNFRVDTTFCRTDVPLPHLEELELSSGEFASFPLFIPNSTSLTHLTLKRCNIDAIPSSIENLEQLIRLNLSYNRLTSLPKGIKNLRNLAYLGLYGNLFSKEEQEKIRSWFPSSVEIVF
jgi:Leucine-rich repeat (LRR) protein